MADSPKNPEAPISDLGVAEGASKGVVARQPVETQVPAASSPTGEATPTLEQVPTAPPIERILTPTGAVTSRIVATPTAASLDAGEMPAPGPKFVDTTPAATPVAVQPEQPKSSLLSKLTFGLLGKK